MAEGKVAIVTAGGSGMGADAARRLAADGLKIAILSSSGKGEALALDLDGLGITGSNQSVADVQRLVDETMERWGRIDVLVNSAGHGPRASILDITDEQWHIGLDVYLLNVVRATRIVAPIMAKQKSGVIINISTAWAFEPSPMFPTSAVFRAGLAAFARIFVDQYARDNVRMNNVLPGWIDSLPATEERRESVPMQRYGKSEEIAATITHGVRWNADPDTHNSLMPAFGHDGILKPDEVDATANFVRSLSGLPTDAGADLEKGKKVFADNCAACHGPEGKGNQEFGAPDLTAKVWLYGSDKKAIVERITYGGGGIMPAWQGKLDPTAIKAVAVYVHALSGGK